MANKLNKKTLHSVFWRSLALQGCFNYERMQAIGYAYAMIPGLRKLYHTDEEMAVALKRHVGFFNTSPQTVSFIMGASLALEEQNSESEEFNTDSINAIKAALMGPLAGIGDAFFWGTFRIIGAGIGATMAVEGNILGPILFVLIYNIPHFILRYNGLMIGYNEGMKFLQTAYSTGAIEKLTAAAKIVGSIVVGAMIATMVNVSTPVVLEFGGTSVAIQTTVFDAIMPKLLPLLLTFGIYGLVKKGYKTTTLMILLIIVAFIGTFINIF